MSESLPSVPGPAPSKPSVSAAISWAFDTFKKNPLPFILNAPMGSEIM